jgi:hypothetical protein
MEQGTNLKNEVLTKREYFAAIAVQGMIEKATLSLHGNVWINEDNKKNMVRIAVEIADKLIEELNK